MKLPPTLGPDRAEHFWKTMLPPLSTQVHMDLQFERILTSLGYLSEDGLLYVGPQWTPAEEWFWDGHRWKYNEDPNLKLLREDPDSSPQERGAERTNVLTRLHLKVVACNPEGPPRSKRDKRRLRTATTQHGYRRFRKWGPSPQVMRAS